MSDQAAIKLTPRERQVLEALRQGLSQPEVAARLGIAKPNVNAVALRLRKKGALPPSVPGKHWRRQPQATEPSRPGKYARPERLVPTAAGRRVRPCIRCGNDFMSEGTHNRMCPRCQHFAADAGGEFIGV